MDARRRSQKRLTRTEVDTSSPAGLFFQIDPAWSPDGAKIAFASRRAGSSDIYVMRRRRDAAHSGSRRRVSTTRIPRGRRTDSRSRSSAPDDIYVMRCGRHLGAPRISHARDPTAIPRGLRTASGSRSFVACRAHQEHEIWMMRPDGSDRDALDRRCDGSSINPAWSPDSQRIVFASNIVGSLYDLLPGRGCG